MAPISIILLNMGLITQNKPDFTLLKQNPKFGELRAEFDPPEFMQYIFELIRIYIIFFLVLLAYGHYFSADPNRLHHVFIVCKEFLVDL